MITLQKLKWSNIFSYGADNELDLASDTVLQIIGTNGQGKSSIPLIIEEALYNKNSKGIKKVDIPNRYVNKGYEIELTFTKGTDIYLVTVNRKSSVKVTLTKNGEDISSHTATNTYKSLQEIIGIDFKTFSQLVYQNPNTSLQFLTATDTNRKKFLIDLLHLENYVKLFDLFKEEARLVNLRLSGIKSKVATVENWLKTNKLTDTNILPLLEHSISTEKDEQALSKLSVEIKTISEENKKIQKNNQYRTMLSSIDLDGLNAITVESSTNYDSIQHQAGSLAQEAASAKSMIRKVEGLAEGCPTCGQEMDKGTAESLINSSKDIIKDANIRHTELLEKIKDIKADNALYAKKVKGLKEWEDLYRNIDESLPSALIERDQLEDSFRETKQRLTEARASIEKINKENTAITSRNTRIEVIKEQTAEFQNQLTESLDILNKEQEVFSSLEVLKKAFSTNGLIAYKIENLVKELEDLTNTYLAELSDGRFTLEFLVTNDKLNVHITDNEKVVDILALSSGELARVNTSTLLAIRSLMSSISKSQINILFLDEVISVLDEQGKEKLVEILIKETNLNSYLVSHQWQHPLLAKIEVLKEDNISRIEQ